MNETNENIVKYFGEYDDLVTANILLQNEINGFPYLKQKDRKDLLNKINKLNIFDDLHQSILKQKYDNDIDIRAIEKNLFGFNIEHVKNDISKLRKRIYNEVTSQINIKQQILELNTKLSSRVRQMKPIGQNILEFPKPIVDYDSLLIKLWADIDINVKIYRDICSDLPKVEQEYHNKIMKNKAEIECITEQIEQLFLQKNKIETIDIIDIEKQIIVMQNKIDNIDVEINNFIELNNSFTIERDKLTFFGITIYDYENACQSKKFRDDVIFYKNQIINLNKHKYNKDCNICLQNNSHIVTQIDEYHKKIDIISNKCIDYEKVIDIITNYNIQLTNSEKRNEYNSKINTIAIKIQNLNTDKTKYINIKNDCNTKYKMYMKNKDLIKENIQLDLLINKLKIKRANLENIIDIDHSDFINKNNQTCIDYHKNSNVVMDLNNKKNRQNDTINLFYETSINKMYNSMIELQIDKLKNKIESLTSCYNKLMNIIMQHKFDLKSKYKLYLKIKEDYQQINELRQNKIILTLYEKALSRNGLPKLVMQNLLPQLQNNVNNIISNFCNFTMKIELINDDIEIYIVKNKQSIIIEMCSVSEKFIIDIAIRIFFSKMTKLSRPLFMIIDEGFTSFDENRIISTKTIFDYLTTQYKFVLIISHLDRLKSFFHKQYIIKKDNDFSNILIQ